MFRCYPLKLLKHSFPESQAQLDFSTRDRIKLCIGPYASLSISCMVLSARACSPLQVISSHNFASIRSHLLPYICSLLSLLRSEGDVTPSFSIATRWKVKCACKVELHTSGRGSSGADLDTDPGRNGNNDQNDEQ